MGLEAGSTGPRDLENLRRVVAAVRRIGDRSGPQLPSDLEVRENVVARLRRFCHRAGAVAPELYDKADESRAELFRAKLKRLAKLGGAGLLVPESPAMGGFGYEINGRLYNLDTLKFHEVLTALRRGGVLDDLLQSRSPGLVVQIGPAWGGFAYQLKTVCPSVRCLIVDDPAHFLLSAPYLMHQFPQARVRFVESARQRVTGGLDDFVFVPRNLVPRIHVESPALIVSIQGFESLTESQAVETVDWGFACGCRFLYSLDRTCVGGAPRVESLIARAYWPHEIPMLPVSFDEMLDGLVRGKSLRARAARRVQRKPEYRHIVGWRRLLR